MLNQHPTTYDISGLSGKAAAIRRMIIRQSYESNVGHIGSALSIADLMAVLWWGVMKNPGQDREDRDRFVLSKGHAALALYACLRLSDLMDEQTLASYCQNGSQVAAHPMHTVPGIEVSTGSLGQGLSIACGRALALRHRGQSERVFAVVSDGEMNEGQTWEAAMFGGHHRLDNLIVVVDLNGKQCLGNTQDILHIHNPWQAWEAFGWDAVAVDGHDCEALFQAMTQRPSAGRPRVYLAKTVLGKGVSFMESDYRWHYLNLDADTVEIAKRGIDGHA